MTITLVLLALSLALDAFAVSISYGITPKQSNKRKTFAIPFIFGLFQAFMPLLGWYLGWALSDKILPFQHWIVFLLLVWFGGKMILDGLRPQTAKSTGQPNNGRQKVLALAFATSVDAFVVGITFALTQTSIVISVLTIGVVTFLLCLLGIQLGHLFGRFSKNRASMFGGLILIAIGTKILFEHLFF